MADIRRCVECGEPQNNIQADVFYPESGLDNVQLLNVPVWVCANGHQEVVIPAVNELHELLARMIIRKPAPLVGREIKFLRRRVNLTAKDFAARIGISPVRLSQIENSQKAMRKRMDLLFRFAFAALISVRDGQSFPADLGHLMDEVEAFLNEVGTHRIVHKDKAASEHEWLEAA